MAEYRRFVSYIYQYDEDSKGGNAGFAKVETRNGTCRISIHVRGVFLGQNESCTIHGLVEDGRRMIAIPLGECKPKNGIIEHKLVTPSERMGESDYTFSDITGIYVDTGRSKTYVTTWAEKRVIVSRIIALKDYEKQNKTEKDESNSDQAPPFPKQEQSSGNIKEDGFRGSLDERTIPEREEHDSYKRDRQSERITRIMPQRDTNKAMQTEPELHVAEKILSLDQIKNELGINKKINGEYQCNEPDEKSIAMFKALKKESLEAEKLRKEPELTSDAREESESKNEKHYIDVDRYQQNSNHRDTSVHLTEDCDSDKITEGYRETEEDDLAEQGLAQPYEEPYEEELYEEEPDKNDEISQKWESLQSHYKQIRPFQDDEIIECIQIEPKDLVHLQKEEWVLGNNSFLLHGYFSYRYLIMGRTLVDEESKIVLGVPGVYEQQERIMANMFGFPYFKPASNQELKSGVFGYWCKMVK